MKVERKILGFRARIFNSLILCGFVVLQCDYIGEVEWVLVHILSIYDGFSLRNEHLRR